MLYVEVGIYIGFLFCFLGRGVLLEVSPAYTLPQNGSYTTPPLVCFSVYPGYPLHHCARAPALYLLFSLLFDSYNYITLLFILPIQLHYITVIWQALLSRAFLTNLYN